MIEKKKKENESLIITIHFDFWFLNLQVKHVKIDIFDENDLV